MLAFLSPLLAFACLAYRNDKDAPLLHLVLLPTVADPALDTGIRSRVRCNLETESVGFAIVIALGDRGRGWFGGIMLR